MRSLRYRIIPVMLTVFAAGIAAVSCDKPQEDPVSVSIRKGEAEYPSSNQFVTVTATGQWELSISFPDATEEDFTKWGYLGERDNATISGTGPRKDIVLGWTANNSFEARRLWLVLRSGTQADSCMFVQQAKAQQGGTGDLPTTLVNEPAPEWLELPATSDSDGLYFVTHSAPINGREVRNYSMYWDKDALVAHWVAYPLNSWYISNGGRTDEWDIDPKYPFNYQPVLYGAFRRSNLGRSFSRGHQCPSADRLGYESNLQTFYGTNMTPQLGELNSYAWAKLEGMVRDWSKRVDTLYVVTGCTIKGSEEYAYDNYGKAVTVPTGYFKALLGYSKNGTPSPSTGGYLGIGFYFEHRRYTNSDAAVMQQAMTLDALEELTGFDFFCNLPKKIGNDQAARVESTLESWWNNNK